MKKGLKLVGYMWLMLVTSAFLITGCTIPRPPSGIPLAGYSAAAPGIPTVIASGAFARPCIATHTNGMIAVAVEGPDMHSMYLYVWTPKTGKWVGGMVAQSVKGGMVDASRVYVGDIEIDSDGYVFLVFRAGIKEWGKMYGPCVYVRNPNGSGILRFTGLTKGAVRLAADGDRMYMLTKDGVWGQVDRNGKVVAQGTFPAGGTGEKFDFDIHGGRWFTTIAGCRAQPSSFASGTIAGGKRITIADYNRYYDQGSDFCYPSIVGRSGTPETAWVSTVYLGRLCLQIIKNGVNVYPTTALADLGPAKMEMRCPPRLVDTPKGPYLFWRNGTIIYYGPVKTLLKGVVPRVLAQGEFANAVWSTPLKQIVVVYVQGANLKMESVSL